LKLETENLEDRQVQLTVEVPSEQIQSAMKSAARRMSKTTKIPGFRPGKAPYDVILQRFGEESVFEEALDSLGQEIYRKALEDSDLDAFAPGSLEEVMSRDPLVLRYTVPLAPEVELGNYRKLRKKYKEPEVEDKAVDDAMEDLRQRQALIEPADRAAQLSDVVLIDVEGKLQEDSEDGSLVNQKGISLLLEDTTDWPFPGIVGHLAGISAGDAIDVEHTFAEDYPEETLQGKPASFHISCLEVKSRLVPEWTDDLAKNIGDFETLLDLRIKVRESLQEQAESDAQNTYAGEVIEAIVEDAEVQFPPILLDQEVTDMTRDLARNLASQNLSLEDYLTIEQKSADELREELEPQARQRLKRALALGKIVELEELAVEDDEVDERVESFTSSLDESAGTEELKKAFESAESRRRIELDLLTEKAIDRVVSISKGEKIKNQAKSKK
jgi:trigger factor